MCGIAGFWGVPGPAERLSELASSMGEAIRSRGPDGRGEWVSADIGLAFSHRRLAIIDLTEAGHQPMRSRSGRWTICFNGEIYNYLGLRSELEAARGGFVWRGHSDTELLVEAIETWGIEATLRRCSGMFAFAAWDCVERRLVLARDRMGEKPLYWGRMPDGTLLFGSELRALQVHPSWYGEIDRDAVAALMHYNCVPAPQSIFRSVRKLPAAHFLILTRDGVEEPRPYWRLADAMAEGQRSRQTPVLNETEWVDRLESVLGAVIEEQMIADVPLGAFLSGGIDSSLVVAMMRSRASRPVKTYTIGFREDAFDEGRFAREVAAHLGTEHHELYLTGQDALDLVPRVASQYDEPFSDSSQLPTCLVSRFAREHVTVALSGDGGDEMFAGYNRYVVGDGLWQRAQRMPYWLRCALSSGIEKVPARHWDSLGRALGRYAPGPLRASPGEKLARIARVLRAKSPAGFYDELISHWKGLEDLVPGAQLQPLSYALDAARAGANEIEYMQAHDTLAYLPDDIMVKVDRAAMAVSLETRAPFLDRRVVEFAWTVPMGLKLRDGKGKYLMRELLARHLPRPLFERPKQGFGIPLGSWLRGPLRDWAEALLDPARLGTHGLINPVPVRQKWQEHLAGRAEWQYHLWDVLMFQQWYEQYRHRITGL
ncbi:asparagine synthase (glutamine-hydrolyzing) [Niveibacterium sp.]|uniref:asparagine synthase (glutamine-hydrolyzing) n=1 Tax=Niveibacterium sp. TaxID=2017444 RepID=UPI0035B4574D